MPVIDRSWGGWRCHEVHMDDDEPETDDPLDETGEGSLVGQVGA